MSEYKFNWVNRMTALGPCYGELRNVDDVDNLHAPIGIEIYDYSTNEYREHDKMFLNEDNRRTHCYCIKIWKDNLGCLVKEFNVDPTENPTVNWYTGTPTHTIDELKKWCERYVASCYIKDYEAKLEKLKKLQEITDSLKNMGFTADVEKL